MDRWYLKCVGLAANIHAWALNVVTGQLTCACFHLYLRQLALLSFVHLASGEGQTGRP